MADDQAAQRRSRLAPPPTGAAATSFRAASGSRFGFGSSTPRSTGPTTAAGATTTARASTLSTARTSTFSSSAFGRTTFGAKTPAASMSSATTQRPSSAESASSRLRQKPAAASAAAAATSAPKLPTSTSELFASDVPPRSASGGSLPFAMRSTAASTTFSTSVAAHAAVSKPAGQLFSMDDSDLGGDDGWGVDSPSNILSPASATDETTTATGASKPFEDEDEFGWADETPAPAPVAAAPVREPTPVRQEAPSVSVPASTLHDAAIAPTATSSTFGWGDEFAYSADATEAPADESGWNDEDEWGTSAPQLNGAATLATEAVVEAPKTPATVTASIQAPPLSTASADLGAILSPSGPAGEFWGDEGDDVLFSDEEQSDLNQVEAPLPNSGGLSLESQPTSEEPKPDDVETVPTLDLLPTSEEPKHEEPTLVQAVADEFAYQETEANNTATEDVAVAEMSEWDDEGDWGEQLRLSEVDADILFSPQARTESTNESSAQELHRVGSAKFEDITQSVSVEQTFETEVSHSNEFSFSGASAQQVKESTSSLAVTEDQGLSGHNELHAVNTIDSTPSTVFLEEPAPTSFNESQAAPEQHTAHFSYGDNTSHGFEDHKGTNEVTQQHSEHHERDDNHHDESVENGGYDAHVQRACEGANESATTDTSTNGRYEDGSHETFQRQVSWETHDDELDTSIGKASTVEDTQDPAPFLGPTVPSTKAEVSFGTSSFTAAELTYGHYHHDHHRTPSEAEVGSVASFAEASSAGATFGGSDHVSDGTYSDGGDYASETRSVFGNSSAHSTAFITEPASSSDGQASNEENGTYDHQSDMSSTVGGGGGAPSSEFDVSSTRSALFENEVASTGFEHGDEGYEYGDSHHSHFEGSYENEYSHVVLESSSEFTEQTRSTFDHTESSVFSKSSFGGPLDAQGSPSPMYSRSSTPATYGVSSSQDLPTASDLEFDHSDTDNMFASQQDQTSFGVTYENETAPLGAQAPVASPSVDSSAPFHSDPVADDANPFASSGSGFPSPPAPPSFAAPPSEASIHDVTDLAEEVLPSADSLFGASPEKNSPFGSFAASSAPHIGTTSYDDPPVSDAGSLFADVPAAPAFGGFEQPNPASASSFYSGDQETSYGYGYDSSYQAASEAFGGHAQYNGFDENYGYHAQSHQSAAGAFAASAGAEYGGANDTAYDAFGSAPGDAVSTDSFFGGGHSTPKSVSDVFGSSGTFAHEDRQVFGVHHGERDFEVENSVTEGADYQYSTESGHQSFEGSVTDHSARVEDFASAPTSDLAGSVNDGGEASQIAGTFSSDIKDVAHQSEYHDFAPQAEDNWSYGSTTEPHAYEVAQTSHAAATIEQNSAGDQREELPSTDYGEPYSGDAHHADSFFGRSLSAPPADVYGETKPSAGNDRFGSFPPRSVGSPPRTPATHQSDPIFENVPTSLREQHKSRLSEVDDGVRGHHASDDYHAADPSIGHEADSHPEHPGPFEETSNFGDTGDHFYSGSANSASPFEQSTEHLQQTDPSALFGDQNTSDVFGEAVQSGQNADSTEQLDPSAFFGGETSNSSFSDVAPYGKDEYSAELSEPSGFFGGQHSNDVFGGNTPHQQDADPSLQSDPSEFFGGQDTNNAFGEAPGNGASGFFSGCQSQQHHAGGIYAHLPQDTATPAYQGYDTTSYDSQHTSHTGYDNHATGFVSGNEYSYGVQNQSVSGAQQSAQHPEGSHYGSAATHDYRSPTAAGASQFMSASQSASAFDYRNTVETAGQSSYPGGQHLPHPDASYRTPTLQPSRGPATPAMDPSPLQSVNTQRNYNQFAAPGQTPTLATAYETKPGYGLAAGSAAALTSNKHKDPNMVAPSCLSSFGFGGNVVTMFPKQKLRLNSASFAARNSPRTPQSMQFESTQGELRKGPVGVYRMDNVYPRIGEFEDLDKFPGPLNESVSEESILHYVEEKMNSTTGSTHQEEDERLLLGILRVLIKCNGRLRSDANSNPSDPASPEVQLVSLLKESDQRRRRNHPSNFPPPKPVQYPAHPDAMLRNASRVRELLLLGDRKAAVDVAIQAQMWPEAMLIGSFTDKDEYKRVLCAYFTSHYAPGDPCRALYLSFADQQERSVHEPQKLMQHGKDVDSSEILSSWVVHVQMLLANRTADTNKILVELGDRLWKESNAVVAAHVCYLLAGNTVEAPSPSSKIALLGADHRSPDEARFYVSPSAVQRTEIYEWVQKRINPAATNMIPFQGYKLIYAMILADHGKLETAFKYVNSMLTVIRAITATMKPGTSMYLEGMQNQLVVLDDRLRQHLGQDRADSVAAAASAKQGKQWGLGSALSIMGKIVNRVVEGNDAPQQAAAPRSSSGSLFPGAPRSSNGNVNAPPEYPSGAAVGYSSQSAPSMVPAAPGSGRSGGIYATHHAQYNPSSVPQPVAAPVPTQAPSVPAAFNVPRQLSGRNSAPPHQPTLDYAAPGSGSDTNAFPAPLSGGNGYDAAAPPQATQPASNFSHNSFNPPPPAEEPPPFQKPSLDLSGSAGKSGFGNESQSEASKPKSPSRSPRARGDGAPGSDKGSASPKAKEAPKKGGRSKTPPPSRSSSGWLSGISTFIVSKMNPDAKVVKLPSENMEAYFDEEKKRWVFPGETQSDEPAIPSAPPTGPLPGSTPGSSSGGPPGGPPGAHSAPGSMAGGAASSDPLAALMAPPPARALMTKDPLAAMMAPPPNRAVFGQRSSTMPAKRPPPRPQFAVFKPAPSSQASSAPSDQGPPSSSGEPAAPPQ